VRTIIDGYNLLLRDLDPSASSLAEVRREFLRRVDAVRGPDESVTVVFDGRPGTRAGRTDGAGVDVRYSRSPRTADDLIVSMVRAAPRNSVTVLTHDRELARRVRRAGGAVGDPSSFFRLARPRRRGPAPREKPRAPRGHELDEWERLFEEREDEEGGGP
jgi:hypothetical protein